MSRFIVVVSVRDSVYVIGTTATLQTSMIRQSISTDYSDAVIIIVTRVIR